MRYVDELTEALRAQLAAVRGLPDQLGYGLRQRLREGYGTADLRADLLAGVVVGVVALPLSMALAVAAGVPPQHGLYAAVVAGLIAALLGGTRVQVTGPTATFVVILLPIAHAHGLAGVLLTGLLAGAILVVMGLAHVGRLMTFIPHPVTTGFTSGVALLIALLQLGDVLGLRLPSTEGIGRYLLAVWEARAQVNPADVAVAALTVGALVLVPRWLRAVPAPLVALLGAAVLAALATRFVDGVTVTTLGDRFSLPQTPPLPQAPWAAAGPPGGGGFVLDWDVLQALLGPAFAVAMLGAIETLTSATIADGVQGTRHDPDAELVALGLANVVAPWFGGIAASGALARTATNLRAGARSPLAAAFHAVFVLACILALAPLVEYLPMAALAGLLIVVAYQMAEPRHVVRLLRIAPRSDVMVLLTCLSLTVLFDMALAVSVGVVLAALLFMRRMAVLTKVSVVADPSENYEVPGGVKVYEIAGPLFFGAAKTAMDALATGASYGTVILSMRHVPVMDATGLVALESLLDRLRRTRRKVIIAALQPEPAEMLARAGIRRTPGELAFAPDVDTALSMAIVHAARG
ncbi:MAG: SulP family inorganic anion transporter [Kofleriaceae bacterium]